MFKEFLKEYLKSAGIGIKELIKALIFSSIINFIILAIGLYIIKIPKFYLVAFAIAIIDLLPVFGAGTVLIPWSIIVFFMGNIKLAISLVVLFIITFIIKQIVEPLILGKSIGLNPIFTIIISIFFMIILSPGIGAIVGAIFSMLVGTYLEVRRNFKKDYKNIEDYKRL